MWYDVRRALDRDLNVIQTKLVNFFYRKHFRTYDEPVQAPLNNAVLGAHVQNSVIKDIQSSVYEEQKQVQILLPHFTIRMLQKLEALVEEGILTREDFDKWVDPDLYKEISKIIQKIVTQFKLVVCSDKSMNKVIEKVVQKEGQTSATAPGSPDI